MALVVVSLAFIAVFVVTYTFGRPTSVAPPPIIGSLLATGVVSHATQASRWVEQQRDIAEPSKTPMAPGTFTICQTGRRVNCVVDGDTVWVEGQKIRVADIDAPETHPPRCDYEAKLGDRATRRLAELVNAGPFKFKSIDRDMDRYGRKLRILVRDGRSLGDQLVAEGLARTWEGKRRPWC